MTTIEGNEEKLLKVRVLGGIAFKVMLNDHKVMGGSGKSRSGDERIFKEVLSLHVQKG